MKTLPLFFIYSFFILITSDIIGIYQIDSKNSGDTLELKKDGTYEYQLRGDSCYYWKDISGTWELKSDILILNYNYSFVEDAVEYIEETDSISKNFVTFKVKDINGKAISGFEIKYWSLNELEQVKKTDKYGIAKFDKYDIIYDENDSVGVGIKYSIKGKETTETNPLYRNSDYITLKINSKPKTIFVNENYRFKVKNGILQTIEFPYVEEITTYIKI